MCNRPKSHLIDADSRLRLTTACATGRPNAGPCFCLSRLAKHKHVIPVCAHARTKAFFSCLGSHSLYTFIRFITYEPLNFRAPRKPSCGAQKSHTDLRGHTNEYVNPAECPMVLRATVATAARQLSRPLLLKYTMACRVVKVRIIPRVTSNQKSTQTYLLGTVCTYRSKL